MIGRCVVESPRGSIVEAGDHGVGEGDGGLVELPAAAREPSVDAGVNGEGVVVERAGDAGGRVTSMLAPCFPCFWCVRVRDDVVEQAGAGPCVGEEAAEREKSKVARGIVAQDGRRLKVSGDGHRVPAGVERAVDEGCWALGACCEKLATRRCEQAVEIFKRNAGLRGRLLAREFYVEDIF